MLVTPTGSFSSINQNTLLNGLVAHWDFEEASGTRFDKVASNHLADNNTVTQGVGKLGNAALFTAASSEWLEVAENSSNMMAGSSFTIAGWVNFTTISAATHCLFSKSPNNSTEQEYFLDINPSDPKLRWVVNIVGAAANDVKSLTNLGINQWYFYECYYDLSNQTIGIATNNGTFGTRSVAGGVYTRITSSPFKFGRFHLTAPRYFNGRQDSVSIWKRLLTPAERNQLWNSGNGRVYPFS